MCVALREKIRQLQKDMADESDILNSYIVPCYEVLHSQSKEYIVEDIISYMQEKGVGI